MKYRVSEIEGALLDRAVALAETKVIHWKPPPYSTEWDHGGPIIERECISIYERFGIWVAGYELHAENGRDFGDMMGCEPASIEFEGATRCGDTPLIAAMRAYVASCFGDEIELWEET